MIDGLVAALGPAQVDAAGGVCPRGVEGARRAVEWLTERRIPWTPGSTPTPATRVGVAAPRSPALIDLWREDLVARVPAGATFDAIDSGLAPLGLRLAASAPEPGRATVGGAFARGERGLRWTAPGSLREFVLGLRAVDGGARLVQGGARVVKNVAGFDLCRLHHGAHGSLGLILDLIVRLEARPEASASRFLPSPLESVSDALASVRRPARGLDPVVQVWVNEAAAQQLGLGSAGVVAMAEGWSAGVDAWRGDLSAGPDYAELRDLGGDKGRDLVLWNASHSQLLATWPSLRRALAPLDPWLVADLAGGGARLATNRGPGPVATRSWTAACEIVRESRTTLWAERLPADSPLRPTPAAGPRGAIERRLKQAFDPHRLLPDPPSPLEVRS